MSSDNPSFYQYMKYPVPSHKDFYWYIDEMHSFTTSRQPQDNTISWDQPNTYLEEYIAYINKRWWLYKSLPFVKQIYLCNSITFNALHNVSDIDICIITEQWYMWRARFWSVIIFLLINIKRTKSKIKKSFCLTFYIDEHQSNIYHLRHNDGDVYLPYRLAHCVLLYTDDTLLEDFLWKENKELLEFLPYHPRQQTIQIWSTLYHGDSWFKKTIQILLENKIGMFLQKIIKIVWIPILYYKNSKLKRHTRDWIIIKDHTLKFHDDKRTLFQFRKKNSYSKSVSKW